MTGSPCIADFRCWTRPEVAILGADQKERGLWGRDCTILEKSTWTKMEITSFGPEESFFVAGQVGVHRKIHTGNSISSITRLVMRSVERNELIAVFNILLMALSRGVLSSF